MLLRFVFCIARSTGPLLWQVVKSKSTSNCCSCFWLSPPFKQTLCVSLAELLISFISPKGFLKLLLLTSQRLPVFTLKGTASLSSEIKAFGCNASKQGLSISSITSTGFRVGGWLPRKDASLFFNCIRKAELSILALSVQLSGDEQGSLGWSWKNTSCSEQVMSSWEASLLPKILVLSPGSTSAAASSKSWCELKHLVCSISSLICPWLELNFAVLWYVLTSL